MKHPTKLFAMLLIGLMLVSVLTGLSVFSQDRDACRIPVREECLGGGAACKVAASPALTSGELGTPTLAPPRPDGSVRSSPSSAEVAKGQPVFLQVETDQNEVEVGWATP
jgi:hypothetical protein